MHKKEVVTILAELFDEEAQREEYMLARDKQMKAEGIAQGMTKALVVLVKDGLISIANAAKRANLSVAKFEAAAGINHD